MNSVIVTGPTGAIGVALINELISQNIKVLAIMRPNSSRKNNLPDSKLVNIIECDLNNLASLPCKTTEKYDVFYHFAWEGTTGAARNDMYVQNRNVKYALDAVSLAHRLGCGKFIGAGSQAEYGRVEGILQSDTPTHPENGYGIAKLCAGQMTRELAHQYGMSHVWSRVLSVYGPCDGSRSLVMSLISKLSNHETLECTKGEQIWDYLYSADAARAFRLIGEKGIDGEVYVIGSGSAAPLSQYIETIRSCVDPKAEIRYGAIPYSEKQVMHLEADISLLRRDTGFYPWISFNQGIRETVEWYKKNNQ